MLGTSPRPAPRLTTAMGQTLALLSLSGTELSWRLAIGAAENPAMRLVPPPGAGRLPPVLDPGGLTAPGDSLIAHVLHQIGGLHLPPRDGAIALALAEALEPTGWLGVAPGRLARACGVPEEAVLAVLVRLQRMEPGGLFARSLAECLRLQAEQAGELTSAMEAVLRHLPLLAEAGPAALARHLCLPPAEVAEATNRIRSYDPKPGLAFADFLPALPPADLLLRRAGAVWEAVPNPHSFSLEVDPGHAGRAAAEALRRALAGRLRIALTIGGLLARQQQSWLGGGEMAAVTARNLAEASGFHLSTVNRCPASVTAQTPSGTKPLRALVSHDVNGEGISAAALRERLHRMIHAAGNGHLSDAALTEQLAQDGIRVARRTVAKYRLSIVQSPQGLSGRG